MALQRATPKHKQSDSIDRYLTPNIKLLQNAKSKIITEIHKNKNTNKNRKEDDNLQALKSLLKIVFKKLQSEFNNSVNDYWYKKISKITHSNFNYLTTPKTCSLK